MIWKRFGNENRTARNWKRRRELPKECLKGFVCSPCDVFYKEWQADRLLFLIRGHGSKDYAEV